MKKSLINLHIPHAKGKIKKTLNGTLFWYGKVDTRFLLIKKVKNKAP